MGTDNKVHSATGCDCSPEGKAGGSDQRKSQYEYDLICIGSGPAGQHCAIQASKWGKRVAVIEMQPTVGGVCVDTGTIPSKTFREAVRRHYCPPSLEDTLSRDSSARPSMEQLIENVSQVMARESQVIRSLLVRNDVALIHGRAVLIDAHTVEVHAPDEVRRVTAEFILIGVGTRPSQPPGVPTDGHVVITSDGVLGLKKLPRTIVVVGAGVIGIEYGSMFAALGVEVTIVDQRPRPLEFLDSEIVDELIHQMRRARVTFRCGEAVTHIDVVDNENQCKGLVSLESGKHIAADVILFSAGRVGSTQSLGLENVGITADHRGRLTVNDRYQTSIENIYAGGDVIGFPALAATSAEQGRISACHMFGVEVEPIGPHFPVGIYSIPEISMVGSTEQDLTQQKIPYETGVARYREIARGQILGDDSGLFKMIFHRDTRKLLGCHCIGSGATELIHIGQAVLRLGGDLDYFLNTVFNYPTLAECYKVAAYNAANKLSLVRSVMQAEAREDAEEEAKRKSASPQDGKVSGRPDVPRGEPEQIATVHK